MSQVRVLMVINTNGLQYDDRLRKESGSLRGLGFAVDILALEYANRRDRFTTYDGIAATTVRLRSRGWFTQGRAPLVKSAEMYLRFLANIIRIHPDVIWCHELGLSGLIPLLAVLRACGWIQRIVWDQHELPSDGLLKSPRYRWVFSWLAGMCDCLVMASHERRGLVTAWLRDQLRVPIEVLENYPDAKFARLPARELPGELVVWLDGCPYLLAQGGANPDRHLDRLVAATLQTPRFRLVVVGPFLPRVVADLERAHGSQLAQRVRFTGSIPQLELTSFIDHAYASVVLYQDQSANTRLCAPNRLYQALIRGVPALVGANPPMAKLVTAINCGVVLRTDGADIGDLADGLSRLEAGYREFRQNAARTHGLTWESQESVVARTVEAAAAAV